MSHKKSFLSAIWHSCSVWFGNALPLYFLLWNTCKSHNTANLTYTLYICLHLYKEYVLGLTYCQVSNIPAISDWVSPAVASLPAKLRWHLSDAEICRSGDICNILYTSANVFGVLSYPYGFLKSLYIQIR